MTRKNLAAAVAIVLAVAACTPKNTGIGFEQRHFADSTAHAYVTLDVDLPEADGRAARAVRASLVEMMDQSLSHADSYEEERAFPRFSGNEDDTEALMGYYEERTLRHVDGLSQADFDDRERSIRENAELTDAEKAELVAEAPKWSYEYKLQKLSETERYLVFNAQEYVYMGGAHGGAASDGTTFRKTDGRRLGWDLFVSGSGMQEVIKNGLMEYFQVKTEEELTECLSLDNTVFFPLPQTPPLFQKDGILFIYQQYEIAAYAAGQPSFILPYDKAKKMMNNTGKQLVP